MNKSENINELAQALAKAQGQIGGALKNSKNPYFKSSFADLESVWEACREPLSNNGLSVVQITQTEPGTVLLLTTLLHSSGQWIEGTYPINPVKSDPQGFGSAISYARRYCLAAIVGIYQTDDDAESAQGRSQPKSKVSEKPIEPGEFVIPIGASLGKKIKDLPRPLLEKALNFCKSNNQEPEFQEALIKYLKTMPQQESLTNYLKTMPQEVKDE